MTSLVRPDPAYHDSWQEAFEEFGHVFSDGSGAHGRVEGEFTRATWLAFWQTAVLSRPVDEVGAELGISPGAVYIARSRVLARLRTKVEELEE